MCVTPFLLNSKEIERKMSETCILVWASPYDFTVHHIFYHRNITVRRDRTPREHDFDFALLELSEDIDLTETSNAKAISLPTAQDNNFDNNTKFEVSGWGRFAIGGRKPKKLQSLTLPWVSERQCKKKYHSHITSRMICAGNFTHGGIDACVGDSGGK